MKNFIKLTACLFIAGLCSACAKQLPSDTRSRYGSILQVPDLYQTDWQKSARILSFFPALPISVRKVVIIQI